MVITVHGNTNDLRLTGLTLRLNHIIAVLKISDDACSVVVMHPAEHFYIQIDCNLISVSSIVFSLAHDIILILRTSSVESQSKRVSDRYWDISRWSRS